MVTVGMNYHVVPGKDELFVAVFRKVLDVIDEMPGHAHTRLLRDVFSEHEYIVLSEWSDEASFRGFISSERFRNVVDWGRENVLASRPTHQILIPQADHARPD
jgi:heme-degrading monooxygenase HmoA